MSGKRLQSLWSRLTSGENNVLNFIYLFCSMFVKYIFGYVQESGTTFLDKLWHRCHFETLSKTCLVIKKRHVEGKKCWLKSTNKHSWEKNGHTLDQSAMQMMHLKAIRCEIWQEIMRTAESFIRLTLTFPSQLSHKKDFSAFTLEKYTFIGSLKLTGGSGPPALRLGTAGAPPRFVSVICRGDIPTLKKAKGKIMKEARMREWNGRSQWGECWKMGVPEGGGGLRKGLGGGWKDR